jgi:polysaccharide chain length determinant protein (PEP-CTERM system associated)
MVVILGAILSTAVPKKFRAEATLIVESSQIPTDLAASTVRNDLEQQLQVIEQRLMSRDNLLDMADRLDLFGEEPDLSSFEIVDRLYNEIELRVSGGRGSVALVRISADANSGQTATAIVNELMAQMLQQDAAYRTAVANDTLSFFETTVRRLGEELDAFNRRILDFQNENIDALPESLDYRLSRQSLLQERLSQARREKSQLEDQRRRLVELFETTGQIDSAMQRPPTAEEQELRGLRAELRQALSVFSETNPRVENLREQIGQLETLIAGQRPDSDTDVSPSASLLETQLVEIDSQIESLEAATSLLEDQLDTLQESIEKTPANSIIVEALMRDRDNVQMQYNTAVDRLSIAATGERIESLSKGQRLSVVEPPVVPTKPVNPTPQLIIALSVIMGFVLGILAIILREFLMPSVYRAGDITKGLGITPLATLPYIETPGEIWRRRGLRAALIILVVAVIVGGLFVEHELVTQFNPVAQEIIERFGNLNLAEFL